MHHLDRSQVAAPTCLASFKHGQHTWNDVQEHLQEIRQQLEQLQGRRCAYCEGSLDLLGQHIEHFRQRAQFPKLTFQWSNLYWSCYQEDCCGRHKDRVQPRCPPDILIDPGMDDPDRFFHFHSDGSISIRKGLTSADQNRAEETLRAFNLDPKHGRLRRLRSQAVRAYLAREPDILEALMEFDDESRRELIEEEIRSTAGKPFCTVIRHFFEGVA